MSERCEITWDGYLHLSHGTARRHFPADVCVAVRRGETLALIPLHGQSNGGLILKRRNPSGDRSLLVNEALGFEPHAGSYPVSWDAAQGALIIALGEETAEGVAGHGRERRADRGHQGVRPVGGIRGGDRPGRDLATTAFNPPQCARSGGLGVSGLSGGAPAPGTGERSQRPAGLGVAR